MGRIDSFEISASRLSTIIWAGTIFIYYLVYEVVFFFYPNSYPFLSPVTTAVKLLFPAALFGVFGLPNFKTIMRNKSLSNFSFFFFLFLAWAAMSSIAASPESLSEWFKLFPRFLFFLGVVLFFLHVRLGMTMVMKFIALWAVLSVMQYVVLVVSGAYHVPGVYSWGGATAGPFGILGNITSRMVFPDVSDPIIRLTGFWNEPSNASATLFASFFFAQWLALKNNSRFWSAMSWIVLMGGFLCFSNAGYLALGSALFFGSMLRREKRWLNLKKGTFILVGLAFILLALLGRSVVSRYIPNNSIARAITGVRDNIALASNNLDIAYNGRIGLLFNARDVVSEHPLGTGIVGLGDNGGPLIPLSASSLVMWYTMVGLPGLLLLLMREVWLWRAIIIESKKSTQTVLLCQAYIVVAVQQLAYGSWMNPLYFIASAAVFAVSIEHSSRKQV